MSIPNQHRGNLPNHLPLTIWGDPIIGQALVLLLRGSGYKAKFLPASPSSELLSLERTELLVLTPTPQLSAAQRQTLLMLLLRRNTLETANLRVLELVRPSEEPQQGHMQGGSWYGVPWPCSLEKLEQHIEAAVCHPVASPALFRSTV